MADDPGPDLAEAFAQIARSLIAETNLQASLQRIVSLAVETIGTCDYAGTSGIEDEVVTSPASSGAVPALVDKIQYDRRGTVHRRHQGAQGISDGELSGERRWPNFTQRAVAESGIESILSLRLFANETTDGRSQSLFHPDRRLR